MEECINVVIADSDEILGCRVAEFLEEKRNINVVAICKNGYDAVNAIKREKPDFVIMDLILQGMDGIAVLEELRMAGQLPSVMITSVLEQSKMIHYACALGADFYICKPYSFDLLYDRMLQIHGKTRYPQLLVDNTFVEPIKSENEMELIRANLEADVTRTIRTLGIPAHIKGYQYIREGVLLSLEDPDMLSYITKFLYPTIAKKYSTTSSSVERAIRHAIGVAWTRGNAKEVLASYGYCYKQPLQKPTNSEFLSLLVDRYRIQQAQSVAYSTTMKAM